MFHIDTITAISTAPGEGGIGIVRMSGPESLDIVQNIFKLPNGRYLEDIRDRYLYYGDIVNGNNETIDEVLMVCMRGPKSYTREDIVEIHCHGGMIPIRRILELTVDRGARIAEPGEFTKRAFLNGRLDLTQAEAVADIVSAKSEEAAKASIKQLEGSISERIEEVIGELMDLIAYIEAAIDYPEEDIEDMEVNEVELRIQALGEDINRLIDSSSTGKLIRHGIKTVIVGKPNVGKSSLLNALVKENRAIVTPIPGTTRDVIEEYITIKGIQVNIMDTAGIRPTEDVVEKIGVERTKKSIEEADLIIAMFDASQLLEEEDLEIIERTQGRRVLYLINKIDMPKVLDNHALRERLDTEDIIEISLKDGEGIDGVENYIYNMVYSGDVIASDEPMVTNIRHERLLKSSYSHLLNAIDALSMNTPLDLISIDLRSAWEDLGSITGEFVTEDIIDRIFSNFCLGK